MIIMDYSLRQRWRITAVGGRGTSGTPQGNRELMAQHEDFGILPPRLTARQPQQ